MFDKERELVEVGPHSYNLKLGGYGGFDHLNDGTNKHLNRCRKGGKNSKKNFAEEDFEMLKKRLSQYHSKEHLVMMREKAISIDSIEKRKNTMNNNQHQQGSKNSQYGTMWITNGTTNRKIKRDEAIPEGWRKGRKI